MSASAETVLQGQHAVVTGGNRGIGAAIAEGLALQGAQVSVIGRSGPLKCDVSRPDDVSRAFAEAVRRSGEVHVLVNNAGQADAAPFQSISLESWNEMLAVNLTGTFLCTQQVLPAMMKAGRGRIVNVASTAGLKGYSGIAAYTASKHGVIGLTRALAAETARTAITVNAVCPGYTDGTDMFAKAVNNVMRDKGVSAEWARALLSRPSPRGTPITTQEVVDAVLWLCSPGASAITGQSIVVAAGEVM